MLFYVLSQLKQHLFLIRFIGFHEFYNKLLCKSNQIIHQLTRVGVIFSPLICSLQTNFRYGQAILGAKWKYLFLWMSCPHSSRKMYNLSKRAIWVRDVLNTEKKFKSRNNSFWDEFSDNFVENIILFYC